MLHRRGEKISYKRFLIMVYFCLSGNFNQAADYVTFLKFLHETMLSVSHMQRHGRLIHRCPLLCIMYYVDIYGFIKILQFHSKCVIYFFCDSMRIKNIML